MARGGEHFSRNLKGTYMISQIVIFISVEKVIQTIYTFN